MSMNSFHNRDHRPSSRVRSGAAAAPGHERVGKTGRRADQCLVDRGLAPTRNIARRLIENGQARLDGEVLTKPAQIVRDAARLSVIAAETDRYVSRGGLKLAGALVATGLSVKGCVCLDVGQSTGGFTDCLLQQGALRVVGVDVGHGQLHPRLKTDPRVVSFEGVNCRALRASDLGDALPAGGFERIVADVSFISLTLILPCLPRLLAASGEMLLLVKPQFEVGPEGVGKGGIVRDPARYAEVECRLRQCCCQDLQLKVQGWFESVITGGDGNREFFIWIRHAQL
jgi:23S rRNA (cytidine1920-2'-O)/16S rRNA (cytidine1409-2'-O)-methyltransferase